MAVWNMALLVDDADAVAEKRLNFMHFGTLRSQARSYVFIKIHMKINDILYQLGSYADFDVKIIAGKPGKSSMSRVTKFFDRTSGKLIVERYSKLAQIDNSTRRAVQLDKWYTDCYSTCIDLSTEHDKRPIPNEPPVAFMYKTTIRYSDLDTNLHTNYTVYIKSCIDCATVAAMDNKLVHFEGDMACYPVLELVTDYLGETFAGDEIAVAMWQDINNVSDFNFLIYKLPEKKLVTFVELRFGLQKLPLQKSLTAHKL